MTQRREIPAQSPKIVNDLRSALQRALSTLDDANTADIGANDEELGTELIGAIIKSVRERDRIARQEGPELTQLRIMISWSGRQSRQIAEALDPWLESVIPGIDVWVSSEDIGVGTRWFSELMRILETTYICILCVTPENAKAPWIHYEAGAIAARGHSLAGQAPMICPLLAGVDPEAVTGTPLAQFQCAHATKAGVFDLVTLINESLDVPHHPELVRSVFSTKWRTLKTKLNALNPMS